MRFNDRQENLWIFVFAISTTDVVYDLVDINYNRRSDRDREADTNPARCTPLTRSIESSPGIVILDMPCVEGAPNVCHKR